tara:strand:- start:152193 stop:152426 length:234 start_codon:yes stop_codon:yes gene_type:complete
MQLFKNNIAAANVVIDYDFSGLGFAGDPNGPDVSPLVTVKVRDMTFSPLFLFGTTTLNLPDFAATLTMEDAEGTTSN